MLNNTTEINYHAGNHQAIIKCELHFKEAMLLTLYILVILLGVVGNGCIWYIFGYRTKQRKTVTELLILYLAFFDLLASIFAPFIFMYWIITCHKSWHFGAIGCKLLPLLSRVFINISVGIILILAIDRYRAICSPFGGQFRKKYIHFGVIVTAVLSFAGESYYIDALTLKAGTRCMVIPRSNNEYKYVSAIILLVRDFIFILVFSATTIRIGLTLRKRDLYVIANNLSKQEMSRVVRVIIVMQLVFIVLVLPRDFLHIIFSLSWLDGKGIAYTQNLINLNEFLKVFQTANCCANIFIYSKLHDRFRVTVMEIVNSSMGCGSPVSPRANVDLRYKRQLLTVKKDRTNGDADAFLNGDIESPTIIWRSSNGNIENNRLYVSIKSRISKI